MPICGRLLFAVPSSGISQPGALFPFAWETVGAFTSLEGGSGALMAVYVLRKRRVDVNYAGENGLYGGITELQATT